MRLNRNIAIIASVAAVLLGAGVIFLYQGTGEGAAEPSQKITSRERPQNRRGNARNAKAQKLRVNGESPTNGVEKARSRLVAEATEEEISLTPEMIKIIASLQACLDNDDRKALTKICDKIAQIRRERGEEAVPAIVRAKAVEAIGHFLPASLAELLAFMADSNREVAEAAAEQFDDVLNDTSIGDRELSEILVSMAKVINNEDTVDSMMMSIDSNMRNSVKVSTCNQILEAGTDTIIKQLKNTIADILEVEVEELPADNKSLQDKLNEWLKANPDDEDDEDFYKSVEE